jgi:metal transporter CNNM
VRKIPLNKVPFVPQNEPLLGILDRFQEGRSHMAIVTRFSREKAESVKQVVKTGLTQRLRNRVGMGDSSSDSSSCSSDDDDDHKSGEERHKPKNKRRGRTGRKTSGETSTDVEMGVVQPEGKARASFQLPLGGNRGFEQSMPADAVLGKEGAEEFLQSLDPAVAPLGIITLEDVLEG